MQSGDEQLPLWDIFLFDKKVQKIEHFFLDKIKNCATLYLTGLFNRLNVIVRRKEHEKNHFGWADHNYGRRSYVLRETRIGAQEAHPHAE